MLNVVRCVRDRLFSSFHKNWSPHFQLQTYKYNGNKIWNRWRTMQNGRKNEHRMNPAMERNEEQTTPTTTWSNHSCPKCIPYTQMYNPNAHHEMCKYLLFIWQFLVHVVSQQQQPHQIWHDAMAMGERERETESKGSVHKCVYKSHWII